LLSDLFSLDLQSFDLGALAEVLFINVVLSGDNAIVVGMAAATVEPSIRRKVILWGIAGAVVLRIGFAVVTTRLLAIVGLKLAGGILLLWVAWKMFREVRGSGDGEPEVGGEAEGAEGARRAILQIVLADLSMSLDNVLAVAGAARDHLGVLVVGLVLSIALMGGAATLIARLLDRFRWIAWGGLAVIVWVAVDMIRRGSLEVCNDLAGAACRLAGG
jgi:YjbE family integral membrane protein